MSQRSATGFSEPCHACMGSRELTGTERGGYGKFSGETDSRTDLSESIRAPRSVQAKYIKTRSLARQARASADGADDQVRQRHRGIQRSVRARIESRDADRGLGHACHVL